MTSPPSALKFHSNFFLGHWIARIALSFAPRLGQIVPLLHCSCSDAIK
jgi:hypothetical protein